MSTVVLTPDDMSLLLDTFAHVALVSGVLGGLLWGAASALAGELADWAIARSERAARISAARARASGGMGVSPMVDLSRATCPAQGSGGLLARLSPASLSPFPSPGASGRVIKLSAEPRPGASIQACPPSRLESRRASGAPGPSMTPASGVDAAGMHCIPEGSASPSRLSV